MRLVSPYRRRLEAVITEKGFCSIKYISAWGVLIPFYYTWIPLCMYGHLWFLPSSGNKVDSAFRNIFTEENGDVIDTYFTHSIKKICINVCVKKSSLKHSESKCLLGHVRRQAAVSQWVGRHCSFMINGALHAWAAVNRLNRVENPLRRGRAVTWTHAEVLTCKPMSQTALLLKAFYVQCFPTENLLRLCERLLGDSCTCVHYQSGQCHGHGRTRHATGVKERPPSPSPFILPSARWFVVPPSGARCWHLWLQWLQSDEMKSNFVPR